MSNDHHHERTIRLRERLSCVDVQRRLLSAHRGAVLDLSPEDADYASSIVVQLKGEEHGLTFNVLREPVLPAHAGPADDSAPSVDHDTPTQTHETDITDH